MNHREAAELLSDFFDGSLSPQVHRQVETHLTECAACREDLASLGALLDTVEDLRERRVSPPRDLWPGISRRIADAGAPGRSEFRGALRWLLGSGAGRLSLAGAGAVAVILFLLLPRLLPGYPALSGSPIVRDANAAEVMRREIAVLDEQVASARRAVAPAGDSLSAGDAAESAGGAWKTFEQSLEVLDRAIRESRGALARDPNNPILQKSLLAAYQKQLGLLRWASHLIRQG